jgi:hypothetical protein
MIGRAGMWILMLAIAAGVPLGATAAFGSDDTAAVLRRDDDASEVTAVDDDDNANDTHSRSGFTSGVDSNDRTGSGHTAVSWDKDRSAGDKTRDRTRDGAGGPKRDWTGGKTNDQSRRDSR